MMLVARYHALYIFRFSTELRASNPSEVGMRLAVSLVGVEAAAPNAVRMTVSQR
jgi:hypothetical protein